MGKEALERKLATLETLQTPAEFRKALGDRNNYFVSKAAAMVAARALTELIPDLVTAFERFLVNPVKSDPQCWAKNAIVKALKDFGLDDASFYLRGMQHVQLEPVWSDPPFADTAGTLRGECAFGLIGCSIPRAEAMRPLVDLLGSDKESTVRLNAARAIAQLGGIESALLLRLRVLAGDHDPEVTGQCLAALLDLSPAEYIPFAAGFLGADSDVRFEAAAALGELPDPAAVEALTAHFAKSSDAETRRAILLSLGASRMEPAADFLLSTLASGTLEEGVACVRALAVSRFRDDVRQRVVSIAGERNDPKLSATVDKEFRLTEI